MICDRYRSVLLPLLPQTCSEFDLQLDVSGLLVGKTQELLDGVDLSAFGLQPFLLLLKRRHSDKGATSAPFMNSCGCGQNKGAEPCDPAPLMN
jgi:hypothetical protein